jgi:hypothetical protein
VLHRAPGPLGPGAAWNRQAVVGPARGDVVTTGRVGRWRLHRPTRFFRSWQLQLVEYCIAAELLVSAHGLRHRPELVCLVGGILLIGLALSTTGPVGLSRHPVREHTRAVPTTLVALALLGSPLIAGVLGVVSVAAPVVGGVVLLRIAPFTRRRPALPTATRPQSPPPPPERAVSLARVAGARVGDARDGLSAAAQRGALAGARRLGRAVGTRSRAKRQGPR